MKGLAGRLPLFGCALKNLPALSGFALLSDYMTDAQILNKQFEEVRLARILSNVVSMDQSIEALRL